MIDLFELKSLIKESLRLEVKTQIRSGFIVESHNVFSAVELQEISEEVEIEDFSEEVDFEGEIELSEDFEDTEDLHESLEFVADRRGKEMDLFVEVDLSMYNPSFEVLGKIRDLFFAEDYEYVIDEASNKARVIFKRSKGAIKKRKVCGPGRRLVGKRCLPQSGSQRAKNRVRGIKIRRAKRAMGGAKKRAAIKAKITKRRVRGRARNFSGT